MANYSRSPSPLPPTRPRFGRRLAVLYCLIAPFASAQEVEFETLSGLLDRGAQAFAQGDYTQASAAFHKLKSTYKNEPQWREARLGEKVLPLAGYAALKAGLYDQAIDSLGILLQEDGAAYSQELFVAYTLALAHKRKGSHEEALEAFENFRAISHSESQRGIARIHESDILLKIDEPDQARSALTEVIGSDTAVRVKTQARLRLLQMRLEQKDLEGIADTLLERRWNTDTMPELALVAFLAIESGDLLAQANRSAEALRAYRLVPSKKALVESQARKLARLKQTVLDRKSEVGLAGVMWTDFYEQLIQSSSAQLAALQNAADYSDPLLIRRGRALLLSNRFFEAWLLFERVASNAESPHAETAHFNWILAAKELGRAAAALEIADRYLKRYPESRSLNDTLSLIADTHIDAGDYASALAVLARLSADASDPESQASARYRSGQCRIRLGDYTAARSDFVQASQIKSSETLQQNARLWIGISLFLERDFEEAKQAFSDLYDKVESPGIRGEALYRIACSEYSLRNYETAVKQLANFSTDYPGHQREFEVQLLLGDSYFAQGKFSQALQRYQSIPADIPQLAHEAALQATVALVEMDRHDDAIATLERRARITTNPSQFAEVHWAAYEIESGLSQSTNARRWLDKAIETHGDSQEADQMIHILEELQKIDGFDYAERFDNAINRERYRLAARLGLLQALALRREGGDYQSQEVMLQVANEIPVDLLPPECLAQIGLALIEAELEQGRELHQTLLETYPESQYAHYAHYGLAKNALETNQLEAALGWLDRIGETHFDSPVYLDARQLEGDTQRALGQLSAARNTYNSILSYRWATSRQKATSLLALARLSQQQGNLKHAIAYCQRVFTLYPGEIEASAQGYFETALRLAEIDEPQKARATLAEFLGRPEYRGTAQYNQAEALYAELEPPARQ